MSERAGWPPAPDDLRVVIGDIHGDWEAAWLLLKETDVVDKLGRKKPNRHVTFIGDIGHWGHNVYGADYYALAIAAKYGDALVGGNHEGATLFDIPHFGGYRPSHMIAPEANRLLNRLQHEGRWQAAVAIDGWLLTHAGLHPTWQEGRLRAFVNDPEILAEEINRLFYVKLAQHKHDPLFDSVGPIRSRMTREGFDPERRDDDEPGGVFWMDAREVVGGPWKREDGSKYYPSLLDFNRVHQIVGHTGSISGEANPAPMFYGDSFIINDVGAAPSGRACALVKSASDTKWTPIISIVRIEGGQAPDISDDPQTIRAHHPELDTILEL
jgi:hypothetical protein